MRHRLASAVRSAFERGVNDEIADVLLELVVSDAILDNSRELANAITPRDVDSYRELLEHNLLDAITGAIIIGHTFVAAGAGAAGAAELLRFLHALAAAAADGDIHGR